MPTESRWQLHEARARFSELVRRAREEGPQTITVRGAAAAVVLEAEEYARLCQHQRTMGDVLRASPIREEDAYLFARDQSPGRDVDLSD